MKLRRIYNPGYKAHNGHVFTRDDCNRYNNIQNTINDLVMANKLDVSNVLEYLEDLSKFIFNAIINNR